MANMPVWLALFLAAAAPVSAAAQSGSPSVPADPPAASVADSEAIRQTARDYIEGWYTADSTRMARAVHPELAKRIVTRDGSGVSYLSETGATSLVRATQAGYGGDVPAAARQVDVTILDIYGDVASVRLRSTKLIDYMHLARWDGRWKIINVLWDYRPGRRPAPKR
ncbi:MAG TPA: nuclear transport factor 2 family protein [Gemmatimonadales bacterium]|nr:nuclear transport factor 2 family protein [Gemmatimonadales bacterium]